MGLGFYPARHSRDDKGDTERLRRGKWLRIPGGLFNGMANLNSIPPRAVGSEASGFSLLTEAIHSASMVTLISVCSSSVSWQPSQVANSHFLLNSPITSC